MKIIDILGAFKDSCRHEYGLSEYTINKYEDGVRCFVKKSKLNLLREVRHEDIRSYLLEGRREKAWKPWTYRTYLITLKRFFQWCVEQGYIDKSPIGKLAMPRIEKHVPRGLSRQDVEHLLACTVNDRQVSEFIRKRNHALLSTFIFTGIRRRELLDLALDDVDLIQGSILVRQGKGNKDRLIPISETLVYSLERYIAARRQREYKCNELFASFRYDRSLTIDGLRSILKRIRQISGVSFTPHRLRHTFATLMLEGGCDIYSLSKLLGHSDIRTTTIYLSTTLHHLRQQIVRHPLEQQRIDSTPTQHQAQVYRQTGSSGPWGLS